MHSLLGYRYPDKGCKGSSHKRVQREHSLEVAVSENTPVLRVGVFMNTPT